MWQTVLGSLLLGTFLMVPMITGMGGDETYLEPTVTKVSVEYGNKRPFSFYYPYNYQYYYPRPQYHGQARSCYWLYTNGTYVYYCN